MATLEGDAHMKDTDKELLELAAKAYGFGEKFGVTWTETEYPLNSGVHGALWNGFGHGETAELWNPLTDDGDALRLAVKLRLMIDTSYNGGVGVGSASLEEVYEDSSVDEYAATRRAIVRASAEIGRLK
jgi:hypothetical protein